MEGKRVHARTRLWRMEKEKIVLPGIDGTRLQTMLKACDQGAPQSRRTSQRLPPSGVSERADWLAQERYKKNDTNWQRCEPHDSIRLLGQSQTIFWQTRGWGEECSQDCTPKAGDGIAYPSPLFYWVQTLTDDCGHISLLHAKKRENVWLEFCRRLMWIEAELESQLIALNWCPWR